MDRTGSAIEETEEEAPPEWPLPNPGPAPTKVALVGKGLTRREAPFGQEGWELWGLNGPPADGWDAPIESHTRWFQLHPPVYLRKHWPQGITELDHDWTRRRGVRLYMDRHYPEYPDSEAFPVREMEALTSHGRYHSSSMDWMIALAILEGFKEISLYGMGISTPPNRNGEPISARATMEYWAGVAEGRGAIVRTTDEGDLFQIVHMAKMMSNLRYGFDREPALDLAKYGTCGAGDQWKDWR